MTLASTCLVHRTGQPAINGTATSKYRELKIGSAVGRFRVIREIGPGGHGVVYQATDTLLGRDVALKAIMQSWRDRESVYAAQNEGRLLSRVDDPHIVAIFDLVQQPEAAILVMELVRGATLAELVRAGNLSADDGGSAGAAGSARRLSATTSAQAGNTRPAGRTDRSSHERGARP